MLAIEGPKHKHKPLLFPIWMEPEDIGHLILVLLKYKYQIRYSVYSIWRLNNISHVSLSMSHIKSEVCLFSSNGSSPEDFMGYIYIEKKVHVFLT